MFNPEEVKGTLTDTTLLMKMTYYSATYKLFYQECNAKVFNVFFFLSFVCLSVCLASGIFSQARASL